MKIKFEKMIFQPSAKSLMPVMPTKWVDS